MLSLYTTIKNTFLQVLENIVKELKEFLSLQSNISPDVSLSCLQCLEASTTVINDLKSKDSLLLDKPFDICAEVFISYLCKECNNFGEPVKSKVGFNKFKSF